MARGRETNLSCKNKKLHADRSWSIVEAVLPGYVGGVVAAVRYDELLIYK
jgi:hypothetical protein